MKAGLFIQVASTFTSTPMEVALQQALAEAGVAHGLRFLQFTQMSEYLLAFSSHSADVAGSVVLLRLEDWLRESLQSSPHDSSQVTVIRQELRSRVEEFVSQLTILSRLGKPVWFLLCPSTGWISEKHNLGTLCRTFNNLVMARVRGLPQVTLLNWPSSLSDGTFEDRAADCSGHVPYTADAFRQLAESLGRQLAHTLSQTDSSASPAVSAGSPELAAYLAGLQVRIQLAPATAAERADVDRLLRTAAAFSLTGEKPSISEAEIDQVLAAQGCMLVSVVDRISDYGRSGLLVYHTAGDCLVVDCMALSCTVLGKQVEYAVVASLGQIAASLGCTTIAFEYRPSGRNQPVLAFLQQVSDPETDTRFALPAADVQDRIAKSSVNPKAWTLL